MSKHSEGPEDGPDVQDKAEEEEYRCKEKRKRTTIKKGTVGINARSLDINARVTRWHFQDHLSLRQTTINTQNLPYSSDGKKVEPKHLISRATRVDGTKNKYIGDEERSMTRYTRNSTRRKECYNKR